MWGDPSFAEEKKSADPKDTADVPQPQASSALKVSVEEWVQAAAECEGKDETEILKKYIQLCAFVSPESPVTQAALKGVDDALPKTSLSEDTACMNGSHQQEVQEGGKSQEVKESSLSAPDRKPARYRRILGLALRTWLLDVPLLLVLLLYSCFEWVDYVHKTYLHEQLNTMVFTEERREAEITYYSRPCDKTDITTHNGADLFLPPDATPEEAYEHQLLHGFTVFPGVLKPGTYTELRQHITSRNRNLSSDEVITVIENDNRFSFGLGTENPPVTKALMEIANHPQLGLSLEKIMGADPSLIEMTVITSTYGAVAQYWHDDVIPTASAIRYGRSFGPSYSIFIVLQNTTKEMGCTSVCPGTHYCSEGDIEGLCGQEGFQLANPEDGYWRAGDALLMNMNSFHRGAAHVDKDGLDRVMLILTFSPKPKERAESRLMSQGITFSLRWDMWGNTLNDLRNADTRLVRPWTYLRALGLYKVPSVSWGVDWITGCSMRMSNEDYGFKDDEFDEFMEAGGLKWLPQPLRGQPDKDGSWYEYLQDTFFRCFDFCDFVRRCEIGIFLLVSFVSILLFPGDSSRIRRAGRAVCRLFLFWMLAAFLLNAAQKYTDRSHWAKDTISKRRYSVAFDNLSAFGISNIGRTTLPTRLDVLIENRYGSEYLAMYEDFVNGHPGNRLFRNHVKAVAGQFTAYPPFLKNATAQFILGGIQNDGGRFLYQGADSAWHWMTQERALAYITRELATHSNPVTSALMKVSRRTTSDYMFGFHRDTVLARKYAVPYQRELETKLLRTADVIQPTVVLSAAVVVTGFRPGGGLIPFVRSIVSVRRSTFPPPSEPSEAKEGDWIASGDSVEHFEDGYWYYSKLLSVSAHADYKVWYPLTKGIGYGTLATIRRFKPFEVNEELECVTGIEDGEELFEPCYIERVNPDGTYDVHVDDSRLSSVSPGSIRRLGEEGDGVEFEYKSAYARKETDGEGKQGGDEDFEEEDEDDLEGDEDVGFDGLEGDEESE